MLKLDCCFSTDVGKVRKIVDSQIDVFFEIENSGFELIPHSYSKGDNVILNKHHFLHGIVSNSEIAEFISKNGILSKEATGNFGNHAFGYLVFISPNMIEFYIDCSKFSDEGKNLGRLYGNKYLLVKTPYIIDPEDLVTK